MQLERVGPENEFAKLTKCELNNPSTKKYRHEICGKYKE